MKNTIYLVSLIICNISILFSQNPPQRDGNGVATFSDDGIWHKNMELIQVVNYNGSMDGEFYEHIDIEGNYYNVVSTEGYIRVDNLTDPRNPELEVCKIYYQGHSFREIVLWKSPTTNKVYAICNVESTIKGEKAKAIIINLTEALDWLNSFTPPKTEIDITNLDDRSKTEILGSLGTETNSNVYIGYIKANEKYFKRKLYLPAVSDYNRDYQPVHTLSLDRISSVLTFSHLIVSFYEENSVEYSDGFVDTYILDGNITGYNDSPPFYGIEDNPKYNHASDPIVPTALVQDNKPIRYTEFNSLLNFSKSLLNGICFT